MKSILEQQQENDASIEVVFVLGHKPRASGAGAVDEDEYIADMLRPCRGRYVLYDRLIAGAQLQYEQYLDATDRVMGLNQLLDSLSLTVEEPQTGEAHATSHDSDDERAIGEGSEDRSSNA